MLSHPSLLDRTEKHMRRKEVHLQHWRRTVTLLSTSSYNEKKQQGQSCVLMSMLGQETRTRLHFNRWDERTHTVGRSARRFKLFPCSSVAEDFTKILKVVV